MTLSLNPRNASPSSKEVSVEFAHSTRRSDEFAHESVLRDLRRALYPHVRRLSRRYGNGNGEVDDIVQETLLAFHAQRDNLDPKAPVLPWLYAVARNKTIDATRRRNRSARIAKEASIEQPPTQPSFGCERIDLFSLLDLLSDREQKILRHTTLEGRTLAEVARKFGVSKVHARVIKHRAIRKLSTMMGKTERRTSGRATAMKRLSSAPAALAAHPAASRPKRARSQASPLSPTG